MFLPQEYIKSIFGCKHGCLVCPITHDSWGSPCPEPKKAFFTDDRTSTMYGTLVLQKLMTQPFLLLQSNFYNLHQSEITLNSKAITFFP
jgi:hypothetical protein